MVQVEIRVDLAFEVELFLDPHASGRAEASSEFRVAQDLDTARCERFGIVHGHEEALYAVIDHLGVSAYAGGHHRGSLAQCLEDRVGESFVGGGHECDLRRPQVRGQPVGWLHTDEFDGVQ